MASYNLYDYLGNKGWGFSLICALFPYGIKKVADVFTGSGTVTMGLKENKNAYKKLKGIEHFAMNDQNMDVVNYLHCVRDKPVQLIQAIRSMPISSKLEFDLFMNAVSPVKAEDTDEYARMRNLCYLAFQGIDLEKELQAAECMFSPELLPRATNLLYEKAELGDCIRAAAFLRGQAASFRSMGKSFAPVTKSTEYYADRIARRFSFLMNDVTIYNEDFRKIFSRYPAKDCLLFCDPPYVGTEDVYRYDNEQQGFSLREHEDLRDLALNTQAKVMITYNDHPLIRELYDNKKFHLFPTTHHKSVAGKSGEQMEELFICNYQPPPDYIHTLKMFQITDEQCEQLTLQGGNENESE